MATGRTILEVEIKLPVSNRTMILDRLRQLGARSRGRVLERNTLYDTPACDFRSLGRLLRLRTETGSRRQTGLLTAKAPPTAPSVRVATKSRYKQRLESEIEVASPARAARLLTSIGLRPAFRYEKYRTAFELPGLHIALDETPVGTFLELEGRPSAIDRVARALGYAPRDYFQGTYWDLYVADCRRKGRMPRNMLFSPQKSR